MKIGITLNEVLRDFIGQFAYTYDKYIAPCNTNETTVESFELINYFKFPSKADLNKFLYEEASLEIFGHADQLHENIMNQFNMFLMEIEDEEEHSIELVSREVNKAIPSTLFFLSKLGCRASNIRFVKSTEEKWDGVDVLITANPIAIENKPKGKIAIKIKTSYNTNVKADYELDSLLEFMKDENLRNKIFNTKTTTYEEI